MANTIESVKQAIRVAVANATGWETIFGPANGPQPNNQYCLVTLKDIETQERDVIKWSETEENFIEHQRQESTLTFEIQTRGAGSMEAMRKVVAYLDSSLREIDLWGIVGSGGHDSIQDISTYQNGKILPACVLSVYIHTTLPTENVVEWFGSLDITTKIGNNIITTKVPKEEG